MSVYYNACENILEILNQEVNVYQMPHGDWAFANCGFVSDGYSSKEEATIAALKTIIDAAKKEIPA